MSEDVNSTDEEHLTICQLSISIQQSAERLRRLFELEAPNSLVELEVDLMDRRVNALKERVHKLEGLHHGLMIAVQKYTEGNNGGEA